MACDPTTDLDDEARARAIAGDRPRRTRPRYADGELGTDSLASGANRPATLSADEIERIVQSRHDMPYRVLGPQPARGGQWTVVRAFMPHARRVVLRLLGEQAAEYEMYRAHPEGLYQTQIPRPTETIDYEYLVQEEGRAPYRCSDPYRFRGVRFTAEDERLFVRGEHSGCSKSSARGRPRAAVCRASSSPYGHRMRSVSASSALSTPGTAAGIRCSGWRPAASGSCSSPASAPATSTNTRSRPSTAPFS